MKTKPNNKAIKSFRFEVAWEQSQKTKPSSRLERLALKNKAILTRNGTIASGAKRFQPGELLEFAGRRFRKPKQTQRT